MPIDPGPFKFSVKSGVRLFEADNWAITIESPFDYFNCTYLDGEGRRLKFNLATPARARLYGCTWRWEGEIGEKEPIPLEDRKTIIERILEVIPRFLGDSHSINVEPLMIEAGLAPAKPQRPAVDHPTVTQIDESHFCFMYGTVSLTVPIDLSGPPGQPAVVRQADLRHWDAPDASKTLLPSQVALALRHLTAYLRSHHNRSLILVK